MLTAEERVERGSRAARRLRREGYVPGIVYGRNEPVSFKVPERELWRALHEGSALIDLKVGDEGARPVIVKEQQHHPVRGQVLHIDLLEVRLDEKIQAAVAVELVGGEEAPGVKEGGILEHVTRELQIFALPTDIPERITVDVSGMDIAGTLPLSQLEAPEGVEFLDDPDETVVATITAPSEVVEEEVEEETALVGEEEEGEAPAEGAPEAEGGGEAAEGSESGGGDSS